MAEFIEIDLENWDRKRSFDFFTTFEDPFFNITSNVDITGLYKHTKQNDLSFNLACLFISQKVVHTIPEFKMRTNGTGVFLYDEVICGSTILMPDKTFSFCYFDHCDNLNEFNNRGMENIQHLKKSKDFNPNPGQVNIIHYSTIPWIPFTAIKHPRKKGGMDSIPKIVIGRRFKQGTKAFLPISVEVHHGLLDGYHLGLYFNRFEEECKHLIKEG